MPKIIPKIITLKIETFTDDPDEARAIALDLGAQVFADERVNVVAAFHLEDGPLDEPEDG